MMTDTQIKKRLEEIADLMSKPGADTEKLSEEIDVLLGTKLPPENKAAAGAWERSHRSRRG